MPLFVRPFQLRRLALALSIASALLFTSLFAQAEDKAAARAMAEQGSDAFDTGDYQKALDLFTRAQKLYAVIPHQLFIARSQTKLGMLVEAREQYIEIARTQLGSSAPAAFRSAQREAAGELSKLDPRIPSLTISVEGPGADTATLGVNAQELDSVYVGVSRPVNPGTYKISAKSESSASNEMSLKIAEGEKKSITLILKAVAGAPVVAKTEESTEEEKKEEAPPEKAATSSGPDRVPAYVLGGVGIVGLGVGTAFAIMSAGYKSDSDFVFDDCNASGCTGEDQTLINDWDSQAATSKTVAIIGFGVGAAALTTAVILWVVGSNNAKSTARGFQFQPYATTDQLGFTGSF